MEAVLKKALTIARASGKARNGKIHFHPAPAVVNRYQTPVTLDPFDVPVETKLNLLLARRGGSSEKWEGENLRGLHGIVQDGEELCFDRGIVH